MKENNSFKVFKMKKIVLILLSVWTLNSCSLNNDQPNYYFEVLPVESFTVPESFDMNGIYEIKLTYKRPTDCYFQEGIYYEKSEQTRIIGIQTRVLENNDCMPLDEAPIEVKFNFECTPGNTHYIFKFYKGEDANGNNIFEEVNIPVNY